MPALSEQAERHGAVTARTRKGGTSMDFDREYELENAGIDAFAFSLMDDEERAEALRDAGLDPEDYDGIEFDSSFDAWSALQDNGLSLWDLDLLDEEEKRETLENAVLDPEGYEALPFVSSYSYSIPFVPPAQPPKQKPPQAAVPKKEAPPPQPPKVYRICGVIFPGSAHSYAYLTNGLALSLGDTVTVPSGPENIPRAAKVVSIGDYTAEAAPYPVEKVKTVLRRETPVESEPSAPQEGPAPASREPEVPAPVIPATPIAAPSFAPATLGKKPFPWWILALAAVVALFLAIGQVSRPASVRSGSSSYTSSRYSHGSSYTSSGARSTTPARPPINRELAMTKEQAERLKGTGYHGTRPNSSAEDIELKAAQNKCTNCGYHTENGVNSLCDYCSWMERYGGGLPTQKAPGATPKPTPRPTPKPTAKPAASDPYHASDYSHPEDFYYDYYDDFWDYEDAEDYWERNH